MTQQTGKFQQTHATLGLDLIVKDGLVGRINDVEFDQGSSFCLISIGSQGKKVIAKELVRVHDDRCGAYARAELILVAIQDLSASPKLPMTKELHALSNIRKRLLREDGPYRQAYCAAMQGFSIAFPVNIRATNDQTLWTEGYSDGKRTRDAMLTGMKEIRIIDHVLKPTVAGYSPAQFKAVWRDERAGIDYAEPPKELPEIRNSTGAVVPGSGVLVGAGIPAEERLRNEVDRASELLRDMFGVAVEKRYNSNGRSGGAYVITDSEDHGIGSNSSIGISIALANGGDSLRFNANVTAAYLHDATLATCGGAGGLFSPYAYPQVRSVDDALDWIKANSKLRLQEGDLLEADAKATVTAVWSDWFDNPFRAIKATAEARGKPEDYMQALEVLRASADWDNLDLGTYLDDVLQEIGGATNIVCQCDRDTVTGRRFRAAYDDVSQHIERDDCSRSPGM